MQEYVQGWLWTSWQRASAARPAGCGALLLGAARPSLGGGAWGPAMTWERATEWSCLSALQFLPEISPCHNLRHLSVANMRVTADQG